MDKIIETCKANAAYLLKEFGGFYPFAYGIKKDGEVISVNTFNGDDFPESEDVIDELKKGLQLSNCTNDFETVCICADVLFTPNNTTEKRDAIQIRINSKNIAPLEVLIPYTFNGNEIAFGESEFFEGEDFFIF